MRKFSTLFGLCLLIVGSLICAGCDKNDPAFTPGADGSTLAGNSLVATGTPWGLLIGTGINIIASTFIARGTAKGAVAAHNVADWSNDDVDSMMRRAKELGYNITPKA